MRNRRAKSKSSSSSSSSGSTISTSEMQSIVDRLKMEHYRSSTRANYHRIWKLFSQFFIRLDVKPVSWENRITLFVGHLIESQVKSNTIRSYLSAIKGVLAEGGINIHQDSFELTSLIRVCKIKNDCLVARLPINKGMLKVLLDETLKWCSAKGQDYLKTLYMAIFAAAYFGLLRIGEIAASPHAIKAKNVHIGTNKNKLLFLLETSKTHNKGDKPQLIKIASTLRDDIPATRENTAEKYCPFDLIRNYLAIRPPARNDGEQFFMLSDNSPVLQDQIRNNLKRFLRMANFNEQFYCFHGFRSGRAGDLLKLGVSVETIKQIGHWRSNAVFTYLRE